MTDTHTNHPDWWAERDSPEYTQKPQDAPHSPQRPQHVLVLTCGEIEALRAIVEVRVLMPRLLARLTQDHNHQETR